MKIANGSNINGVFHTTNIANRAVKDMSAIITKRYESMNISKDAMQKLKTRALEKAKELETNINDKLKTLQNRVDRLGELREINKSLEADFDTIAKARNKLKDEKTIDESQKEIIDEKLDSVKNEENSKEIDWSKASEKEIYDYLFDGMEDLSSDIKDKIMDLIIGVVDAEKKKAKDEGIEYDPKESVVDELAKGLSTGNIREIKHGSLIIDDFLKREIERLTKGINKLEMKQTLLLENPEKAMLDEYVKNPYSSGREEQALSKIKVSIPKVYKKPIYHANKDVNNK